MQVDFINSALAVLISGALCGVIGFILGKIGITTVQSDISMLKGLVSGQQKVTVVPAQTGGTVVTSVPASNT